MSLEESVLKHLANLVSFDTTNPPRAFDDSGLFAYLQQSLPDFEHKLWNHGEGRISLLSVRGRPTVLFNFHVDTVPASPDWDRDPWTLQEHETHVSGLGSCDIKGAAAAMLCAVQSATGDAALLFTSDEEAGNSHCVKTFIADQNRFRRVIVAEPTQALAIQAHRGILTGVVTFKGTAGHASAQQGVGDSAVHKAIAWGQQALSWAATHEGESFENLHGVRFNIGCISGGIKPNMIAPDAQIKFGLRFLPTMVHTQLFDQLIAITEAIEGASIKSAFIAPAFTAISDSLIRQFQLPAGEAVDFWTEAALFSQAGFETIVFGPGDIAQAHTANEWVSKEQLINVAEQYIRMIEHGPA